MGEHSQRLTILFAMIGEWGHHSGTLRLARRLREAGHRVVYLSIADMGPQVADQGFEFVAFAEDVLPRGLAARIAASRSGPAPGLRERWRRRREDEALFRAFRARIDDGCLDECIRGCRPDLVLCDTLVWYVALRAQRAGIPVVNLSIVLSTHPNWRIPPFLYGIAPGDGWRSRAVVRMAWAWLRASALVTKGPAARVTGFYRHPTRMHHLMKEFRRAAVAAGQRVVENEHYRFSELGPRLMLPELMLCPRAFQLPGCPETERVYLSDFVDDCRVEEPLAPGLIDPARPLVLCSLGSSPAAYPLAPRFFEAVFEASRLRPDWQFVLHVGNQPHAVANLTSPANLLVRERVPQLTLLASASAMVTHGGINSMMECVQFGVPMVVVPGARDQPGNAQRGLYHHLAVTAAMSTISGAALVAAIARVIDDPELRRGLAAMKKAVEDEGGLERSVAFLEQHAKAAPTS